MSRVKFTATWPAKPVGAEVTWPGSARVYLDRDSHRPVAEAYLDRDRRVVVWSESSVTLTCGGEALTCSSGSPTQTGAAVAGSGLPVPGSGDAGKVVTVTGGEDGFELDAPAGGASELLQHIVFPFAFDTVGLTDGVVVHTPTADVFVVGAWIAPTPTAETPWDGTTPLGDVGDVTQTYGMWGFVNGQLPALDSTGNEFGGLQQIPPKWDLVSAAVFAGGSYSPIFRFAAGTDIGVWVTQNGYRQGADPGSTQGAATVHLLLVPAT